MLTDKQKAKLNVLTKDDWQYIEYAVAKRVLTAGAKKGEPPASREFTKQVLRIQIALQELAFGSDVE